MTVNDNESYLNYLNKLGDKYKKNVPSFYW